MSSLGQGLGDVLADQKAFSSPEGAQCVRLTNKTGAPSVKGTVVEASTGTDDAFASTHADDDQPIGVVYEDGVADGDECYVAYSGRAQVLLKNGTAGTHGNWVRTSITDAGRANATLAAPPGGGIPELDQHMSEIGHCLQTIADGTDVLCWMWLHLN